MSSMEAPVSPFSAREARGVAYVAVSTTVSTSNVGVNVAIWSDHDRKRKTLAASAGLRKFLPIPPKSCFTTTIATNAPTTGISGDTPEGRFMASRSPVTAAERSETVLFLLRSFCTPHSKNTQATIEIATTAAARPPNMMIPQAVAGNRAISTSSIIFCVVTPFLMWGEGETVSRPSVFIPLSVLVILSFIAMSFPRNCYLRLSAARFLAASARMSAFAFLMY